MAIASNFGAGVLHRPITNILNHSIMSKTVDSQIEKSKFLIQGLRNNLEIVKGFGFTAKQLDDMERQLDDLAKASEETEAAYAVLDEKRQKMNAILDSAKDIFTEKKKVIKANYPQEKWINFGVQDKR